MYSSNLHDLEHPFLQAVMVLAARIQVRTSLLEAVREKLMCKQQILTDMKISKCLVVLSCLLASCSGTDEIAEVISDGEIRNAVVRIEPFVFDDGETRTDLTYKDNVIKFSWDDDETIGVFPISAQQLI